MIALLARALLVCCVQDYLRELENAIVYGLPYLLQDVEEELDPALEPVLNKSIIKRGNREVIKVRHTHTHTHTHIPFIVCMGSRLSCSVLPLPSSKPDDS